MYIKKEIIQNVSNYDISTESYVIKDGKNEYVSLKWDIIKGWYQIYSYDNLILLEDAYGTIDLYKKNILIKKYTKTCLYFHMTDKNYIFSYERKLDKELGVKVKFYNLIDFVNDKIILDESVPYPLEYSKGIIIGCDDSKKKLVRLNKDTSIVWEYDLSKELPKASYDEDEEDYLDKFIGILGAKLWFLTEAGRLVVLDVETGKVLKVFSGYEEDAENGFEVMFVDFCKKEGDEDYLYGIGDEFFYKLDVHQLKIVEEYCFIDGALKVFESIMYPNLQGAYFTFLAEKSDRKFRYAGVYDYINRKTVWVEEIISEEESKKGNCLISPEPLQMHGDKLYIKDYHQNLHIFGKEQTSV